MEQASAFVMIPGTQHCVGLAFLIQGRTLMTCAHVINTAIGRDPREVAPVPARTRIPLEFLLVGSVQDRVERWAEVIAWQPTPEVEFEMFDVALLKLGEGVDRYDVAPLVLSDSQEPVPGSSVALWGPGPGGRIGQQSTGRVLGAVAKNRFQIDEPERRVVPGYSGGAVCDDDTGEVIGMVQAVPRDRKHPDVYLLAAPLLREVAATAGEGPSRPSPRPGEGHLLDHAELHYDGSDYRLRQVRHLYNGGRTAIANHEFKVAVEHDPYDDEATIAKHHAVNPLVTPEQRDDRLAVLEVEAWFTLVRPGRGQAGHPDVGMRQEIPHSRIDFVKKPADQQLEFRLRFPPDTPLAPEAEAIVEYCYRVSDRKWGQWFQRSIKPNTERLTVDVHLPASLEPECWGMSLPRSSSIVTALPGVTPKRSGDTVVFSWKGSADEDNLDVGRRIRLEWFFWTEVPDSTRCTDAATVLGRFGIRQVREPHRDQVVKHLPAAACRLADSPEDRAITHQTLDHLRKVAGWVGRFHRFSPAVSRGLAAPQLGMAFPVVIVSRPNSDNRDDWLELVNPQIVAETSQATTDYEGCLSFFDFRGRVTRPWGIRIVHDGADGEQEFTGTLARSIQHEIDHLRGKLYTHRHRMKYGDQPVSVLTYREQRVPPPEPPTGPFDWHRVHDSWP